MSRALLPGGSPSTGTLRGRLRLSAPQVVLVVLLAVAAWRVAAFIGAQQAPPQPDAGVPPAPRAMPPAVDIAQIQRANLFGHAAADASGATITTSSEFILAGAFSTGDPLAGYAMLGPSATSIAVYRTGAEVAAGIHLQSVYRDYVLLERAGELVKLELPRLPLLGFTASVSTALTPTAQMMAARPARPIPRPPPGVPLSPGQVLRTQVVRQNGKLQGYRLFPGTEQKVFQDAGLRTGDVVVAVNGRKPGEPASDLQQVLNSDRSARLTIMRGGVQQELMVSLDRKQN